MVYLLKTLQMGQGMVEFRINLPGDRAHLVLITNKKPPEYSGGFNFIDYGWIIPLTLESLMSSVRVVLINSPL